MRRQQKKERRARQGLSTCAAVLALASALAAAACEEESFRELRPELWVCVEPEVSDASCNRPLDLGELPIGLPLEVALHVINRGDAPLTVSRITCAADTVQVEPTRVRAEPGATEPVTVTVTPAVLGAQRAPLIFDSDDEERSPLEIELRWLGLPEPIPRIELCIDGDAGEACGTELELSFGSVRRSQTESRTVTVHNRGTAPLQILDVSVAGRPSIDGEFAIATSTRPGELAPDATADVVVVYQPADGIADQVELRFRSDDPEVEVATVTLSGNSVENRPPVADARQAVTGATSFTLAVGETAALDGSGSSDPEGDPLRFEWQLQPPAQSAASLDDPDANLVSFVPDRAGSYRVELLVYDSLEQRSELVAVVLIEALPRHALRATLSWQAGGDVYLHLVAEGGTLFGARDCYFENPRPDLGVAGVAEDDPTLLSDAEAAPGVEEIVIVDPAPGRYRLYAHYFDDAGEGQAVAAVRVTFNDASFPMLQDTRNLPQSCALWYVGDVLFPEGSVESAGAALSERCYGE